MGAIVQAISLALHQQIADTNHPADINHPMAVLE
jgi:hypothetical protein